MTDIRRFLDILGGGSPALPAATEHKPLSLLKQLHEMAGTELIDDATPEAPVSLTASLPVELDEASMSRIMGHLESGVPFIQLTAARAGLSNRQIRTRNNQVIAALRAFHLGPIETTGGWDEHDEATGERNRVKEESLFVPLNPRSDLSNDELLELGEFLGRRFNQDAIIFGDGENIFVVEYVKNEISHIGTYDTVDTHGMPYGWTAVGMDRESDGKQWAWTFPDDDHAEKKAARQGRFADLDHKAKHHAAPAAHAAHHPAHHKPLPPLADDGI